LLIADKNMRVLKYFSAVALFFSALSCQKIFVKPDPPNTPQENFQYLWNDINNRYSFLQYKHINWDSLYNIYSSQIHSNMTQIQLFNVLANMMNELRDDHVNLSSPFNVSIYYPIILGSPQNFDNRLLLEHYLLRAPQNYYIAGSLNIAVLDTLGHHIGYIRYSSFLNPVGAFDIDFAIAYFRQANVDGVIIDVRNNGGGDVSNIFPLADRFADQKRLAYTSQLKLGPGADDFGDDQQVYIEPEGQHQFTGKIAVLTNRSSYSATSFFTLAMKSLPYVRIVGDSTGGGLGAPTSGELPNGWIYRFSVTQTIAPGGENWEIGIPADFLVDLDPSLAARGYDSIIERAIQYIITGK
jgi:Peptidase family S41/Tricorn protease C1 domain